jgi:hypothetical protein
MNNMNGDGIEIFLNFVPVPRSDYFFGGKDVSP